MKKSDPNSKLLVGWQEWCALPDLGTEYIKAKVDTGAKTSSLHTYNIKPFIKDGVEYVSFDIHPIQGNNSIVIQASAKVVDQRYVMSSSGHKEKRYVIKTTLSLGNRIFKILLTLSNRDPLIFRMLLGRQALSKHFIIDPGKKNCFGQHSIEEITKYYI